MLMKRFLNKLGLVTADDLLAIQTELEGALISLEQRHDQYRELRRWQQEHERDFESRFEDIETAALTKDTFNIDDWFDIDMYRDHVDEWIEQDLSQRDYWSVGDHLDLTEHFSLCDWDLLDSDDIETLIADKLMDYEPDVEQPCIDDIAEQVTNVVCEKIGGAILGLTHEEPKPATPDDLPTPYVDPVLKQIIEEPKEPQERDKLIDPLMDILNEL